MRSPTSDRVFLSILPALCFLASAAVLGLAAYQASVFMVNKYDSASNSVIPSDRLWMTNTDMIHARTVDHNRPRHIHYISVSKCWIGVSLLFQDPHSMYCSVGDTLARYVVPRGLLAGLGKLIYLYLLFRSALASYTTDRIGYVQCESLVGTRPTVNNRGNGTLSTTSHATVDVYPFSHRLQRCLVSGTQGRHGSFMVQLWSLCVSS